NLNRTLDRQGMKEFENRVLFQMSSNDSSTLIDAPAASKLGENRALYYSEEENRIEKFRPYGLPNLEWLEGVKRHFSARPMPEVPVPAGGNGARDGAGSASAEPRPAPPSPTGNGESSEGNGPSGDGNGSPDFPLVESHSSAIDDLGDP